MKHKIMNGTIDGKQFIIAIFIKMSSFLFLCVCGLRFINLGLQNEITTG